ncbi:hypothetical protein [Peribacillus glennii]|uniref:Uncharacterized protein n=1 Tax=Peribacillus glennii TaxID=2303991 RepID=A0A372LGP9_9BACI|nr:hypothetical protein [Peribacillus glennii]RFU65467.1 hypothetical protein D0466_06150 [Peribacillus glennii]
MFDPTAFENMKVVLEGALYDKEFSGEAVVTNRRDIVNLSSLSRQYEIEMALSKETPIRAGITLQANIENLASELLPDPGMEIQSKAGCIVSVSFTLPFHLEKENAAELIGSLEAIWGKKRTITITSCAEYSNKSMLPPFSRAAVSFGRLVTEEQMDDLLKMADFMADSLSMLEALEVAR